MAAFFSGLAIALALVVGGFLLYSAGGITTAQRSSPQASVRLHAGGEAAQPIRGEKSKGSQETRNGQRVSAR